MLKTKLTIRAAEEAIQQRFIAENFQGELRYDPAKVIETERWWYVPYCWLGCNGFIVSKDDLYVNWLGSALSIDDCFWGHDHGLVCGLVDFRFSKQTNADLVARLVARFKHMHPNASGVLPREPVWYRTGEVESAISQQFPTFKRHFVWFCIPELKEAWEGNRLRFICCPSERHGSRGMNAV